MEKEQMPQSEPEPSWLPGMESFIEPETKPVKDKKGVKSDSGEWTRFTGPGSRLAEKEKSICPNCLRPWKICGHEPDNKD